MHDSKYFSSTKKGELVEWRQDLVRGGQDVAKATIKRVIAAMTVGKDVSSLFPDIINCMQTEDIELKKLVYLYAINYARSNPDLAILAVNTFVKDSQDPNPLVRALAVRTMGCIRVAKIAEYLCDPLQLALQDPDPYVRKTAVMCVAKLYSLNAELVMDRGFFESLKELLFDKNPMVAANTVAALVEIQHGDSAGIISSSSIVNVLAILDGCTEWGQVTILNCLIVYDCASEDEAVIVLDKVLMKLQHANYAVVLASIRVLLNKLGHVKERQNYYLERVVPPLITMLNAEPEIQFVALQEIRELIVRWSVPFSSSYKAFFCKYNDATYVKYEKLSVLIELIHPDNVLDILYELKEYAGEVDIDFARKAIQCIGRCAVTVSETSKQCVDVLLEIINTKVNYAVQEAIVVMKDILRRYPGQYEGMIKHLCDVLESLDEPEAKRSFIWILGEYADRIENIIDLLASFVEGISDESITVQLQILSSVVKLFFKLPSEEAKVIVQQALQFATNESEHPDLRDRAYVYWRLLSHVDMNSATGVIVTGALPPAL